MSKDIEREQAIAEAAAGEPLQDQATQLINALQSTHAEAVSDVIQAFGEITVVVPRERIVELCEYLKTSPEFAFNLLADICGVDRGPEEDPRFEVNYHLFSTTKFHRLRLKVIVSEEDASVPTVTNVWRTANWHERETFDMFGVRFDGHPDLRRILLPDDWQGHALRKDFPLRGYEPYSLS
ncbi:MAG: NADH-quinone oxidoreductase subunit [Pyrinomonadaceae bacterium]|jgi:NADH-quinone oxidoreductase subunit C|nr:NADH-quinone oxidoreductase subunit [Pyrinomonadaceae bacterium]